MKNKDQNKFRKAKHGKRYVKESAKAEYEDFRNNKIREFAPQHENLVEIKIKQAMYDQ